MDENETKINIRKALRVTQTVMDKGVKEDNAYRYKGLYASSDFDGYTAMLYNDYVSLHINFHNTFTFEYSNSKARDAFLEKVNSIDKTG